MASKNPLGHLLDRLESQQSGVAPRARSAGGAFSSQKDVTGSPFLTCVYEGTGEAVIVFQRSGTSADVLTPEEKDLAFLAQFCDGEGELNERALIEDALMRQAKNLERANRRAVTEARRFAVRNGLTKLWTLTYAIEATSKAQIKSDVNDFMQRWRRLQGNNFPYLYVIEEGTQNGRLHVHVAVPKFFTKHWQLEKAWGHGWVQYSEKNRKTGEPRSESRRLAQYLCKYLVKSIEDGHEFGEHRYERAEGFAVPVARMRHATFADAKKWLENFAGEAFEFLWSDYEKDSWEGPPTWLFRSG